MDMTQNPKTPHYSRIKHSCQKNLFEFPKEPFSELLLTFYLAPERRHTEHSLFAHVIVYE